MILIRRFGSYALKRKNPTKHLDTVRGKGLEGLQVESLPGRMKMPCSGKKGKDFILGCFYVILNLEVGREINITSLLQCPLGQGKDTPPLVLSYPMSMQEEQSNLIEPNKKICKWNLALWAQRGWVRVS
jgi:hypothetical protein